ncbi:probable serine/threonine-protein kinase kinX isoform X2 [Pseudophryne corroboree]
MGAKLSKKKKGYCLGAGKDGESTETTEVEPKETETQEGQKDAAEPLGEKTPIDQTKNNGVSEEPKAQAEKRSSTEVTSGETTKENSNKDQKPENNPSTEQKQVEETNQLQNKLEYVESSSTTQEKACEGAKDEKSPSGDKPQTDCDLKKEESVAKETQESLLVVEQEVPDIIQPNQTVTQQASSAVDKKEVESKHVTEPATKVEVEKEKSQTVMPKTEQVSEQATKEVTQVVDSVIKPELSEKVPEVVELLGTENVLVEPVSVADVELVEPKLQEPVSVSDVEPKLQESVSDPKLQEPLSVQDIEPKLQKPVLDVEPKLQEPVSVPDVEPAVPEPLRKSVVVDPEPLETHLPVTELVKSESDLVTEPVEPALSESVLVEQMSSKQPADPVPVAEGAGPVTNPESCPESEQVCEIKETKECPSEQLPSNEVPDHIEDNTENKETLGSGDQGINAVEIQSISESVPAEQTSDVTSAEHNTDQEAFVMQNGISEDSVQDVQANASAVQEVEDKQKGAKEEGLVLDKQTEQVGEDDCNDSAVVILESSKNETDQTTFKATTAICDPAEDKTENEETPGEERKDEKESSAPQIINKHGVGNGLPLKEEIKVHIENGSDKDLHELNGQGEGHEIQVCNE